MGCADSAYVIGPATYHDGPVMHGAVNYAIFWLPPGYSFENFTTDPAASNPSDSNYENLIERYFHDVSGSSFYGILQQYVDGTGPPGTTATFGGAYVDTTSFPGGNGTMARPLSITNIIDEIYSDANSNGWSSNNGNNEFFLFTPHGVYSEGYTNFCAYHSWFYVGNTHYIFSLLPDAGNGYGSFTCLVTQATSNPSVPNDDPFADSEINLLAHEQFESVSDPQPYESGSVYGGGWFYQDPNHEIGDECVWQFGPRSFDGGDLSLNGDEYIVQMIWSNSASGCYLPPQSNATLTTSITLSPTGKSSLLSSGNEFKITYTSNGVNETAYYSGGTVTLSVDRNTNALISALSTGSSPSEEWVFDLPATTPTVHAGDTVGLNYYDLLAQATGFSVSGGGSPASPTLVYSTAPSTPSSVGAIASGAIQLSQTSTQVAWALRGSSIKVSSPISGNSSSERWSAQVDSWIASYQSQPTQIVYYHQFFLKITGVTGLNSQWWNASSTALVPIPGVYDRAMGSGQRVVSYSLDGGAPVLVQPTAAIVGLSVKMDGPHEVAVNSVPQYEVSLDVSSVKSLASITTPAITGDGYWYDEGTPVTVILNGVWNRTSGSGDRLVSYSINGQLTSTSTRGRLDALAVPSISQPENITSDVVRQYLLDTGSGSVASITPPPIQGDVGWYDNDTLVVVTYHYSWNSSAGTRLDAIGYSMIKEGGGATVSTSLVRSGYGTFQVNLAIGAPEVITVTSVRQYSISIVGGFNAGASVPSPTDDSYYDAGSAVRVSTAYTWDVHNSTRQNLLSYTLDGTSTNVTRADSGVFTTPTITIGSPHQLRFNSVEQYLVTFQFEDSSGKVGIVPKSVQVTLNDGGTITPSLNGTWIDAATRLYVSRVSWENASVEPTDPTDYSINSPTNVITMDRVYSSHLSVKDYLGVPVSGAKITVQLANGTQLTSISGSNGSIALREIPLGTYNATISYLGSTTRIKGDIATQATVEGTVFASYPTFGVVGIAVVVVATIGLVLFRRANSSVEKNDRAEGLPPGG